jgi:DNA polymerase-1
MTLNKMEKRGPTLDWENWRKAEAAVPKMLKVLDRKLGHISGVDDFTCTDAQVATLIYDTLRIKPVRVKDKTGGDRSLKETWSTGKAILQQLEAESKHPVFPLIFARRALSKIKSGGLQAYERSAKLFDGELRTRWKLNTVTGRLTSSGKSEGGLNLQNLHRNTLLQNMLVSCVQWRDAILGALDDILDVEVFLVVDCSQAEIRALAELSQDPVMIKLLLEAAKDRKNKKKDFHALNGHMLTGRSIEQIATDESVRRSVKNLIFGIIFGKAENGMYEYVVQKIRAVEGKNADLTGITKASIAVLYKKFFTVYAGVRKWIDKQRALGERLGYVETLFGFRRHIRSDDTERKTFTGNQSINSPVQGSAHTYMLIALALLDLKPVTYSRLLKCIMEVHDALYFKVRLRHLVEAHAQLIKLFETDTVEYACRAFGLKLRVPLLVDSKAGFCMGSMVTYEGEPVEVFLEAWRKKQSEMDKKKWEDLMPAGESD